MKDGTELPGNEAAPNLYYSPDGASFAYETMRGDKRFIVKDGAEGAAYDIIMSVLYSPNGKHLAYEV
jgi:hypothetical protein